MKVVVTGAAGFLGSSLCKSLARDGVDVVAVVRESSDVSVLSGIPRVKIVNCDLREYGKLASLIAEPCDAFFHFAWRGVSDACRGEDAVQIDNVSATAEAVRASRELGCRRFVFASSIIEHEAHAALDAHVSLGPSMIYGIAKNSAAHLACALCIELGLEYVGLLLTNVFGVGERSARLIISSISRLQDGMSCDFSPGDQTYDFIYIDDAVRAMLLAAASGVPGRTYYIGSGKPKPLRCFLETVGDIVAPHVPLHFGALPSFPVRVDYEALNPMELIRDMGFIPQVDFDEGIRRTADWLKQAKQQDDVSNDEGWGSSR